MYLCNEAWHQYDNCKSTFHFAGNHLRQFSLWHYFGLSFLGSYWEQIHLPCETPYIGSPRTSICWFQGLKYESILELFLSLAKAGLQHSRLRFNFRDNILKCINSFCQTTVLENSCWDGFFPWKFYSFHNKIELTQGWISRLFNFIDFYKK